MLVQTITWTILLSVVLHGMSAPPLAKRYGAALGKAGDIPEKAAASEPQIHELGADRPLPTASRCPTTGRPCRVRPAANAAHSRPRRYLPRLGHGTVIVRCEPVTVGVQGVQPPHISRRQYFVPSSPFQGGRFHACV